MGPRRMLIDVVRQLGTEVDQRWARQGYALDAFASIATDAIERFTPHDRFDLAEFGDWLTRIADLPDQLDPKSKFGDPPITIWRTSRFVVDLYFWTTPETALHDHGFTGAFTNLLGESLHGVYRLGSIDAPEPGVMVTDLNLQTVELLDRGSIRPILGGRQFVHRVTHISRPTVTLTVRTVDTAPHSGNTSTFIRVSVSRRDVTWTTTINFCKSAVNFYHSWPRSALISWKSYVKQLVDQSDARSALRYRVEIEPRIRPAAARALWHAKSLGRASRGQVWRMD